MGAASSRFKSVRKEDFCRQFTGRGCSRRDKSRSHPPSTVLQFEFWKKTRRTYDLFNVLLIFGNSLGSWLFDTWFMNHFMIFVCDWKLSTIKKMLHPVIFDNLNSSCFVKSVNVNAYLFMVVIWLPFIAEVNSRCFHWFPAAMLVPICMVTNMAFPYCALWICFEHFNG